MARWNTKKTKQLRGDPNKYPWNDLRFPLIGQGVSVASGRLDFDYFNGAINFNGGGASARFPQEPVSAIAQMSHDWLVKDPIHPHMHWIQEAAGDTNWLLAYKKYKNGGPCTVNTDFTTDHTLVAGIPVFTYVSGDLLQISSFGDIDMTDMGLSDTIHLVLFRDSANTSTLFAGADTTGDRLALEVDIHYRKRGSNKNIFLGSYFPFQHLGPEYQEQYGADKKE